MFYWLPIFSHVGCFVSEQKSPSGGAQTLKSSFCSRSKSDIGTIIEDNIRRTHTYLFINPGTYSRDVQETP
jgi:hypothetical protein